MSERGILFMGDLVRAILAGKKTVTRRPVKALRVQLRHEVTSDLPAVMPRSVAPPGAYAAEMNRHGAVSVRTADGRLLGVKPEKFDFLCPYAQGHTYLRKHPDGRAVWNIRTLESRLWVRETWQQVPTRALPASPGGSVPAWPGVGDRPHAPSRWNPACSIVYRADGEIEDRWRPGIHMPRWASRATLEVTGVRLERVQDITEEEARAEGVTPLEGIAAEQQLTTGERFGDATHRAAFAVKWDGLYADGPYSWTANPWVWAISFRRVTP